jgi:hypothetical protein
MARQYYSSARIYISDTIYPCKIYPLSTRQAFLRLRMMRAHVDMESSCESNERAQTENQQRTVQQIWGWKESQLVTVWNQHLLNVAQRVSLGQIIWNGLPSSRAKKKLRWEGTKTGHGEYYFILNKRKIEENMGDWSKRRFIICTVIHC